MEGDGSAARGAAQGLAAAGGSLAQIGEQLGLGSLGRLWVRGATGATLLARQGAAVLVAEVDTAAPASRVEQAVVQWLSGRPPPRVPASGAVDSPAIVASPAPAPARPPVPAPPPISPVQTPVPLGKVTSSGRPATVVVPPRPDAPPSAGRTGAPARAAGAATASPAGPVSPGRSPVPGPASPAGPVSAGRSPVPAPASPAPASPAPASPAPASPAPAGPPRSDAAFSGRLAVFALPDLLEFLRGGRRTGQLRVTSSGRSASLRFRTGWITGAACPGTPGLLSLLVSGGWLAPAEAESLEATAGPGALDGGASTVLVRKGLVPPEALEQVLLQQTQLTLRVLVGWQDGSFVFTREAEGEPGPQIDPQSLLLDLYQQLDENLASPGRVGP